MIFEEKYNYETKVNADLRFDVFIYFLLYDEEVVYVGQTTAGISRPLNHIKDKNFNCIKVIYCSEKDLGKLEQEFIIKYDPVYNKTKYLLQRSRNINTLYEVVYKEIIVEVELKNENLNIDEFCEWFSIKKRSVERWIDRDSIPYMIVDGEYMFNKKRVLDFFENKKGEK